MSSEFYDGTKLLSMKDLNNKPPEIYICTSNRTAGKTVFFNRYLINRFINHNEKFALIYRYSYELDDCADKFFKDIKSLFFPSLEMSMKKRARGLYVELFLNEKPCGYAVTLNSSETLKKFSHLLSDVERMLFDEFQSESGKYCSNEITKFISLHTSIARGGGKSVRYVPVFLVGNPVTLLNPYYVKLGIPNRLKKDTKFLRGDGYILEQSFNEHASNAQLNTGFNRAFSGDKYIAYSAENVYLDDNSSFIEKPTGRSTYMATLKCDGKEYAIRSFPDLGLLYIDKSIDATFKTKLAVTTDDHNLNYVVLKRNDLFFNQLRYYFEKGCFRFKDLECKNALLKTLSY